ncbi:Ig-like domain-containing protein [Candidatus Peregrinibacteria bacterium]|nr:Ig-like domain-containing protein [Candidatus Peregrinibacteria bacterium]
MKDFITKIVNSFLAVVFAFGIVTVAYQLTKYDAESLSASIMDGRLVTDVSWIDFVTPKGAAYPVNGVVTIQSVHIEFTDNTSGNVSGSDLENSFIYFGDGTIPCPAGTVYSGNKIILPSSFSSSCSVAIYTPLGLPKNTVDLIIEPVSCAQLKTSILRGYGEGFENITPSDLGSFAVTDDGGSFKGFDFGPGIDSIDINYPTADSDMPGAKTFQIHVDFVPDISTDPINGIDSRAMIYANNGSGIYEIKVRDEGTGNEILTALNFAYVFNDLLGTDTPFIAYPLGSDPAVIALQATEMGDHPHDGTGGSYVCIVDGTQIGPPCFSGGADGTNEAAGVLTTPLKLDNEILQGETAIVFASNSVGEIEWITSHPSILEVVTLSEADEQGTGVADFLDTNLTFAETVTIPNGAYSIDSCEEEYEGDPPVFESETCQTSVSIPVSYDISTQDYTVNVTIDDEVIPVTVKGSTLNGFLEGTSTFSTLGGAGYSLSGTVSGIVTGSVSGAYSGTVTGQIQASVTASATLPPFAATGTKLTVGYFTSKLIALNGVVIEGVLTDVPGTFTTTVKKEIDDISHVSLLYAKRSGTSILSALDKQGCIASFEIEVIKKQVRLQMVGRDPGDVLDVADTVQINAYVGGANAELEEYENITAASGIEYFSSNQNVATIDSTGLLTALKPGVTNITARYDTGEAEIGTIESLPLQVTVNKISGLRVTFDEGTQDLLPATTVKNAHKSVIVAIHDPEAAGQTFFVEGQSVSITLPAGTYNNEISKVEAIVDQLETDIDALTNPTSTLDLINVTTIDGYPGMLILQPNNQSTDHDNDTIEDIDENEIIDISTTALEKNVSILPTYNNAIPLPTSATYGLMVVAQYDNGATRVLTPTQFKWVNTPVNYLEQASLDAGLIRMGEMTGTSTVVAEYENADGSVVQSNYLTITVDSGPVIDYVRRIGSIAVTKGSRINLQTKISDVNTIADIQSINTSLVYSSFNTYQQINEDSGAIWFTATPFLNETQVVDQGVTDTTTTEGTTETTPAPVVLQYKTYDIPIEIPADANMFDGVYKLILTITDTANHTLNYVYPIRIGVIAGGDVNGDSVVNMVDVILAFQIAAGINKSPTPEQLKAANVDGAGGVTLVDVILLFNKVTNKQ